MSQELKDVLLALVERYHKDRVAQEAYVDERARRIGRVTLDAFMSNVATELHQRFGISLEGLAP